MTQEHKELLLKDFCARLPYGVKIYLEDFPNATLVGVVNEGIILHCDKYDYTYDAPWDIGYIKPYLFPLDSMTEEQKQYLKNRFCYDWDGEPYDLWKCQIEIGDADELIDWFHKNHIDYRGLIPMGLATDATNLNIY